MKSVRKIREICEAAIQQGRLWQANVMNDMESQMMIKEEANHTINNNQNGTQIINMPTFPSNPQQNVCQVTSILFCSLHSVILVKNPVFRTSSCNFFANQGKFKPMSKPFHYQSQKCFKIKFNVCMKKTAITCFKDQVYLYGSEALTYLNTIL